jgi:hypothetical protein
LLAHVRATPMNPAPLDLRDHLSIVKARKWIVLAIVA